MKQELTIVWVILAILLVVVTVQAVQFSSSVSETAPTAPSPRPIAAAAPVIVPTGLPSAGGCGV